MSDAAFFARARARLAGLEPDVRRALERSLEMLRRSLSEAELRAYIARNDVEGLLRAAFKEATLDKTLTPLRVELHDTVKEGFSLTTRDFPARVVSVAFNYTNPRTIAAVRALDHRALGKLKSDIRETVRAHVEQGLRTGASPATVARNLRSSIGLAQNQVEEVANYRDALLGRNGRKVSSYKLGDKRAASLFKNRGPLTEAQADRYTELYRKRRIAQNSNTVARTLTLQSYKEGQDLAWHAALEDGELEQRGYRLMKRWRQIQRPTRREEHIRLNGEVVPFLSAYSNGSVVPGDQGEYNCGCISQVFVAKNKSS